MKYYRPCKTARVTQYFGENPQYYVQLGLKAHNGIDIGCPYGDELRWPGSGRGEVLEACDHPTWGKKVVVMVRENGRYFKHYFGHIKDWTVKEGQIVETGDLLGHTNNTGKYTTGPHLHWGFYECDQYGNILNANNGYGGAINQKYEDKYVQEVMTGLLYQTIELMKKIYNLLKK